MKNPSEKSEYGLFTIGEMARLCRTTKDALYFYERKGLIKPYFIDDNGYRYYDLTNFYDLEDVYKRQALHDRKNAAEHWSSSQIYFLFSFPVR